MRPVGEGLAGHGGEGEVALELDRNDGADLVGDVIGEQCRDGRVGGVEDERDRDAPSDEKEENEEGVDQKAERQAEARRKRRGVAAAGIRP